ncbi:hypothetical protein EA462_02145 [Natrarchaeobius halalkaliphilus]|uniref:Uncharacterized protein n=1 Tax=Natrarchaeobius halalkaliphilus TaxID=1679091 RepID=A0A3N6MGG3_9EURY|nr:hypothetical protein [Natrarchaeobius halalkaliphilus]RQG93036.1 hypothetical protein EA462_02145 [Natrarchaeobius halalkaliphilus]
MTRTTEPNSDDGETMADVSHANPYTGRATGQLFTRGPIVAADGGERVDDDRPASTDSADTTEEERGRTMASVDHTPPKKADDANRVFERGHDRAGENE